MRLYQVNWKQEIAPYEANHKFKSTVYGWFYLGRCEHFFPYTRYQQKILKRSWVMAEDDISKIKSIYFDLEYLEDREEIPNGFVISGKAKELSHVREVFERSKGDARGMTKEELEGSGFVTVHFNPDKLYIDRILLLHITSISKIIEIDDGEGKGNVKIWIPFSISALDVTKKLKITQAKIEGVRYVQKK